MSPPAPSDPGEPPVVVPAVPGRWADLQAVLGTRGSAARCGCQRYKLAPRESFGSFPAEERMDRLRRQLAGDAPLATAEATAGLLAYLGPDPVGWCAVEPRPRLLGLVRNQQVPWLGRDEDRTDDGVWSVTCFVTRIGFRRRGVAGALAAASVGYALGRGAHAVEGYPIATTAVISEELHVGTVGMFARAGFREVARPTRRRVVMRVDRRPPAPPS